MIRSAIHFEPGNISRVMVAWSLRGVSGLLIIGALCFTQGQAAEPQAMLTLDQAFALAAQNNPQYKVEAFRVAVGEAELKTAGARQNPVLMSDNGIAERTYRLGVEQLFEIGGKRQRRMDLAKTHLNLTRVDIQARLLDLRTEVRRAYTQLYVAQERHSAYQNILQTIQDIVERAKKRGLAGDISELDVLQAEIIQVNTNNDLQMAELELVHAKNRLNALLNHPLNSELTVAPPNYLPRFGPSGGTGTAPAIGHQVSSHGGTLDEQLDQLIQQAYMQRPELRAATAQLDITQKQLALSKAERIPNLRLAAGPDLTTGEGGSLSAFIMGFLEVPLFNRQQGPIQEALARQGQLRHEQDALRINVALEVTNAYTALKGNQDRLQRYETQLIPYAATMWDKSTTYYREERVSILTPVSAQQGYMGARMGYFQALMDYQDAISALERAVGVGL